MPHGRLIEQISKRRWQVGGRFCDRIAESGIPHRLDSANGLRARLNALAQRIGLVAPRLHHRTRRATRNNQDNGTIWYSISSIFDLSSPYSSALH